MRTLAHRRMFLKEFGDLSDAAKDENWFSSETSLFTSSRSHRPQPCIFVPCPLLGGVKRAREIYRRVDETTQNHPWSIPTTEELWHAHAEGVLMEALTNLNLPTEAQKSARLLRAVPNCRLVLMLAHHMLSPALSVEEAGLMTYLQSPPDAGPSMAQVTSGLQNWKCAGRRLAENGGRLPTCYLLLSFERPQDGS